MCFRIAWLIVLAFSVVCVADTIHVPADQPTIQAGIDAAVNGDTVLVARGMYVENIDFLGKAISVRSEVGAEATVIDGNQVDYVVTCKSGEGANTILNGFTLTNGNDGTYFMNGGMHNVNSSPTVIHCIFSDNENGSYMGGGMYNQNSNPRVAHCEFINNPGGGMDNEHSSPTVIHCTFVNNGIGIYAEYGSPTIKHCIFTDTTRGIGGDDSHLTVSHCTFSENQFCGIEMWGGTLKVSYCAFFNNTEPGGYGGGIDFIGNGGFVTQSIFVGNSALEGSALSEGGMSGVFNCTFYGNKGPSTTVVLCGKMINCIVWNNYTNQVWCSSVTHSCIQGGHSGIGNIDSDPRFVYPAKHDLHLTFESPCKDTGNNTVVTELFDFENDPRIAYGTVDMGADEFHPHLYCTGEFSPGGSIEGKFIGLPDTWPVGLFIGSGIMDPPLQHTWGEFFLEAPWMVIPLLPIPSDGVLVIPETLSSTAAPYDIPMQALIGWELSNLYMLEVR